MRVLLDTNVALWLAEDPNLLEADVVDLLGADSTILMLSAIVPWEVAIKWRTGKLRLAQHPREWAKRVAEEFGIEPLPIAARHVTEVADLPDHHKDPFDRMLIAQAQVEQMPIVTADRSFAKYDVEVIPAR